MSEQPSLKQILEGHELTGDEAAEFISQPDFTGDFFESGEQAFGHATIFDGAVERVRLFREEEDAERDFDEFSHPKCDTVFFVSAIEKVGPEHVKLQDVSVNAVDSSEWEEFSKA